MAVVVLVSGKRHIVSAEQGRAIWQILNNERQPRNKAEADYCLKVKQIFLNRYNAPQSYLDKYAYLLVDQSPVKIGNPRERKARLPYKD